MRLSLMCNRGNPVPNVLPLQRRYPLPNGSEKPRTYASAPQVPVTHSRPPDAMPGIRRHNYSDSRKRYASAGPASSWMEQRPRIRVWVALAVQGAGLWSVVLAAPPTNCSNFDINAKSTQALGEVEAPRAGGCNTQLKSGYPVPDPKCTPGAVNPTLTVDVLRNPEFRTSCVRDNATSATQKANTYVWYSINHPDHNQGVMQVCELDHLVSLELGGADSLDNIWPQCGPPNVVLRERYFKEKDAVENYLAKQVRDGVMDLKDAQHGIAEDWTQYREEALKACTGSKCNAP